MEYELKLQKISKETFSQYGIYINRPADAPAHSEESFDWWDNLAVFDFGGKVSVGIVRAKNTGDFQQNVFEYHRDSIEVLIPIDDDVIIVVGNSITEAPHGFDAFLVPRNGVVALNKGVLHRAPMCLNNKADTLVMFKEATASADTQLVETNDIIFKVIL